MGGWGGGGGGGGGGGTQRRSYSHAPHSPEVCEWEDSIEERWREKGKESEKPYVVGALLNHELQLQGGLSHGPLVHVLKREERETAVPSGGNISLTDFSTACCPCCIQWMAVVQHRPTVKRWQN